MVFWLLIKTIIILCGILEWNESPVLTRQMLSVSWPLMYFRSWKKQGWINFFFDTLEGKTIITQDKPYVIPETGQEGFFTGHYSALRNESGKVVGALGIIRDISDQKVWKQKITEKDEFLRKIIHSDLNLMFVKHRNGKYVEVSDGLAELFGTSSDYLVGKTDLELAETRILSTCEAEKIRADDMEVLDTGKKKFIEEESITQK